MAIGGQESFLEEARQVLRAGLETASWISVDGLPYVEPIKQGLGLEQEIPMMCHRKGAANLWP